MTIGDVTTYYLMCDADGCLETLDDYHSETFMLQDAEEEGWDVDGAHHYCPEHAGDNNAG